MKKRKPPIAWSSRYWDCGEVPMAPSLTKLYDRLIEYRCDAEEEIGVYEQRIERFVDDNVALALKDYCRNATVHLYSGRVDEVMLYLHSDADGNEKRDIKRLFSLRDMAMEVAEDSWAGTADRHDMLTLAEHFETLARELRERHQETETAVIKATNHGRLKVVK